MYIVFSQVPAGVRQPGHHQTVLGRFMGDKFYI
jgi:hypothetical protein